MKLLTMWKFSLKIWLTRRFGCHFSSSRCAQASVWTSSVTLLGFLLMNWVACQVQTSLKRNYIPHFPAGNNSNQTETLRRNTVQRIWSFLQSPSSNGMKFWLRKIWISPEHDWAAASIPTECWTVHESVCALFTQRYEALWFPPVASCCPYWLRTDETWVLNLRRRINAYFSVHSSSNILLLSLKLFTKSSLH